MIIIFLNVLSLPHKTLKHLIMQTKFHFLRLTRLNCSERGTEGKLELFEYYNHKFSCIFTCDTLEPVSPSLVEGQYILKFTYSPKFSSKEPYKNLFNGNVPIIYETLSGETLESRGIRIHCGNTSSDTNGCILVGRSHRTGTYLLEESRLTYSFLMTFLQSAHSDLLLIINDIILPF